MQTEKQGGAVLAAAHGHSDALAVPDHAFLLYGPGHSSLKILDEVIQAEMPPKIAL
jgi:hypothetical protein